MHLYLQWLLAGLDWIVLKVMLRWTRRSLLHKLRLTLIVLNGLMLLLLLLLMMRVRKLVSRRRGIIFVIHRIEENILVCGGIQRVEAIILIEVRWRRWRLMLILIIKH